MGRGDVVECAVKYRDDTVYEAWTKVGKFDEPKNAVFLRVHHKKKHIYIVRYLDNGRTAQVWNQVTRRAMNANGTPFHKKAAAEPIQFDGFTALEGETVEACYQGGWYPATLFRRADRQGVVRVFFHHVPKAAEAEVISEALKQGRWSSDLAADLEKLEERKEALKDCQNAEEKAKKLERIESRRVDVVYYALIDWVRNVHYVNKGDIRQAAQGLKLGVMHDKDGTLGFVDELYKKSPEQIAAEKKIAEEKAAAEKAAEVSADKDALIAQLQAQIAALMAKGN